MIASPVSLVPSILAAVLSPLRYTYIYIEVTSHTNFFSFHLSPNAFLSSFQLQKLILSGELPCSKEEAAILAVIQLRIEETSPQSKENESRGHLGSMLPSASLRQSSIIEEKLRPICEDVKVCCVCVLSSTGHYQSELPCLPVCLPAWQLSVHRPINSLTNE